MDTGLVAAFVKSLAMVRCCSTPDIPAFCHPISRAPSHCAGCLCLQMKRLSSNPAPACIADPVMCHQLRCNQGCCRMQILVTELGDETFIIAAIMAMRHPRLVVYAGAMSALGLMTVRACHLSSLLYFILI